MQSNNYFYIPIELFNREMNGALVLALTAASKGWFVFLGSKKEIISLSDSLPKGIFYLKSIVPGELEQLKRISNNGRYISVGDALLQRYLLTLSAEMADTLAFYMTSYLVPECASLWYK